MKKQSFILKVPFFLATRAGCLWLRMLLASCYALYAVGHSITGFGTLFASCYAIFIYQILYYKFKNNKEYRVYLSFLLQRIIFYTGFVIFLAIYSNSDGKVSYSVWQTGYVIITTLSILDVFYAVKGMVGIGFIDANKKNND